jgi:hypothetical protein
MNLFRTLHARDAGRMRPAGCAFICWFLCFGCESLRADVITEWDARATAQASPAALGEREVAIVDLSMFDAVNSLAGQFTPYLVRERGFEGASPEAAAASAAATSLARLHPDKAPELKGALDEYLQKLAAPKEAVVRGVKLGERVAQRIFEARAHDGAADVDSYRPRTQPGKYVPTATMVCATWPTLRPFVLESPAQFRPGPPPALSSAEWAADYNEVKEYGARESARRTPEQTETARFWLMTGPEAYHPIAREFIEAHQLPLIESARFMAMYAVALTDTYIAVFDAKYHYEFWRPLTAIRNADLAGNSATVRDPTWRPIDVTPMHPEYPCAHCSGSAAAAAVIEASGGLGPLGAIKLTSPTAPGVTHRWSTLESFTTEVANARVWAGFHYRSSARAGTALGREVGRYVAGHFAQPLRAASRSARATTRRAPG